MLKNKHELLPGGSETIQWRPPLAGMYKVNRDVAIDTKSRCMGVGIIAREYEGHVYAATSQTVRTIQEPVVAEANGVLKAAEFCRDWGPPKDQSRRRLPTGGKSYKGRGT